VLKQLLMCISYIDTSEPCPHRKRTLPIHLQDAVFLETTGSRELLTMQQFKISLYYSILDAFLVELKRRFNDKNEAS